MSYVVASKIKEYINAKGMMSSGDLAEAVSKLVEDALGKSVKAADENGRKTVRGVDFLVFGAGNTSYVIASAIKQYINGKGMMSAGDLADYASAYVEEHLSKAVARAQANGRKTVRGEDL